MLPSEVCHETSVQACHECDDLACGDNRTTFPQRIPIDAYNAIEAVNYSTLKHILKSPRHYRHAKDVGTVQTEAMIGGIATHVAVLEPERFAVDFVVWDAPTKNGSGKVAPRTGAQWEHFKRLHPDKTILTVAQHEHALAMQEAVRADPSAAQFLQSGEAEVALVWTDEETQLLCKGRVDWITEIDGEPVIVGLKTAVESGPETFPKQANRLLYHLQWAMYAAGYETLTGKMPRVVEVVVESKPPYDPVTYEIGLDVTGPGLAIYREAMFELARCGDSNE